MTIRRLAAAIFALLLVPALVFGAEAEGKVSFHGRRVRGPVSAREFLIRASIENCDWASLVRILHPEAIVSSEAGLTIQAACPVALSGAELRAALKALRSRPEVRWAGPLFSSLPTRLALTGQIIVRFRPGTAEADILNFEAGAGLTRLKSSNYSSEVFLYRGPDSGSEAQLCDDLAAAPIVLRAVSNIWQACRTRAIPDDTLFTDQWHLLNTGQGGAVAGEDINITSVWDTYRGSANEVIAIVDDGLEVAHEDLAANIIANLGWNYITNNANTTTGEHGTAVAGVAAAVGFNNQGVTGVAPSAGLGGFVMLGGGGATVIDIANALTRQMQVVDISNNSWGLTSSEIFLGWVEPEIEAAFVSGITNGRDGLGTIYVWAAGNEALDLDDTNYEGYTNSRYTITVAASVDDGTAAYYSCPGAVLIVNAPSNGGFEQITTTDRTGGQGYEPGPYTDTFGGTSSAAPVVSGLAALMLEANPGLGWRDVQRVLIESAFKNDPGDPSWAVNGAGFDYSHLHGFGRVDAQAAVSLAEVWANTMPEISSEQTSDPNLAIPDNNPTGVSDTITIADDLTIEFVEIYFTASDHPYWGDLEITLTSPDGAVSVLAEPHPSLNFDFYNNWRFGSTVHYGESSQGDWILKVVDAGPSDLGTFESWRLKVFGIPSGPEIDVIGGIASVSSGDTSPDLADLTDFGAIAVGGNATHVLRIANGGNQDLLLTGGPAVQVSGTHAAEFAVTLQPSSPISANRFSEFNIQFDPAGLGLRSATISIDSNDADESVYTFDIQGTGFGGANVAPIASAAGTDPTTRRKRPHSLSGSDSSDPDLGPLTLMYSWAFVSGPVVILPGDFTDVSGDGMTVTWVPPATGVYTFELTVDDGVDTDTAQVSVKVSRKPDKPHPCGCRPEGSPKGWIVLLSILFLSGIRLSVALRKSLRAKHK